MAVPVRAAVFAAQSNQPDNANSLVRALFHVTALSDPGLLSRLIEPVAKLGHVPTRVHATREAGDGSELAVDLRLAGVERSVAERVAHALRSVIGVNSVIAVFEAERG
jgi:hypothetical protein